MMKLSGMIILILLYQPVSAQTVVQKAAAVEQVVLEDFSNYPAGWEARGGIDKAVGQYRVVRGEQGPYLRAEAKPDSVRIFKKIAWDPLKYPVIQWQWRVKSWPPSDSPQVAFYISLDKDIFGIPSLVKYLWSKHQAAGTIKDGGFFRPTEIVVQGGNASPGEWKVERVNALADFKKIAGRDPKGEAYGIGILVDPGVEAEFGKIIALKE
jgi:hypothetical protein